jgi:hypothetical protein
MPLTPKALVKLYRLAAFAKQGATVHTSTSMFTCQIILKHCSYSVNYINEITTLVRYKDDIQNHLCQEKLIGGLSCC